MFSLNRTAAAIATLLSIHCAAQDSQPWSARPEVVQQFQSRRGPFNYDEAKVPHYTLPDPLVASDGRAITSPQAWSQLRRGELIELFRSHVYGRRPSAEYRVQFAETARVPDAFEGAATGRSMTATVLIGDRTYSFPFVVFIPNNVQQPVPAVVHINNRYFIPLDKAAREHDPFWPAKTLIARGYATASFHTSDVDPDKKDGYADGIRAFFADAQPPQEDAWRSLSAWGWAASQVLDYLATQDTVDAPPCGGGRSLPWRQNGALGPPAKTHGSRSPTATTRDAVAPPCHAAPMAKRWGASLPVFPTGSARRLPGTQTARISCRSTSMK